MIKIPIGKGPNTGKTTLINALRVKYPEAHIVEEPAEPVIARELEKEVSEPGYRGIFPVSNYRAFLPLVIAESLEQEAAIAASKELVFQDRSLIDNIGYMTLNQYEIMMPTLKRYIEAAHYTIALLCAPVSNYSQTAIRHENEQ